MVEYTACVRDAIITRYQILRTTSRCSRWCRVISNNPVFWQEIWTTWPPKIVELYETRSKNQPLRILKFRNSQCRHDNEGSTTARLLALNKSRIHTAHIEWTPYVHNEWMDLSRFMEWAVGDDLLPQLTQLHLNSSFDAVVRLQRLNAPILKSLMLTRVVLDPPVLPSLAHVTTLRSEDAELVAEDVIGLLGACPRLEFCNIRFEHNEDLYHDLPVLRPDLDALSPTLSGLRPRERVPLSALQDLTLDGLHWKCMAKVLDHFDIPRTSKIRLVPLLILPDDKSWDALSAVVAPRIRVSLYDSIEVCTSTRIITLYNSSNPGSLTFEIEDQHMYTHVTPLITCFACLSSPSSSSITLHLSSISIIGLPANHLPTIFDIWSAFSHLPNLETISLLKCKDTINNFLSAFKYDPTTVLCSRLKGLDLQESYYDRQVLSDFLRERREEDGAANIEWIRVVEGLFSEEILEELRGYVTVLVDRVPCGLADSGRGY